MAKDTKRRQKAAERKRRKHAERKRKQSRQARPAGRVLEYMRHAGRAALRECLISTGWRGLSARVVVSRDAAEGAVVALFNVDRGCRGVRDVLVAPGLDEEEYADLMAKVRSTYPLEPCSVDLAAKLIRTAVDYGTGLGFAPPKEFRAAWQLLRDGDAARCDEDLACGSSDGRPVYAPDADEDPEPVLRKLTERLGPEGFDYLPPVASGEAFAELGSAAPSRVEIDRGDVPADFVWRKLRLTEATLTDRVIAYGAESLGAAMLAEAWSEFDLEGGREPLAPDDPLFHTWFLPWVAFTWEPFDYESEREQWPEQRLGLVFLEAQGERLDAFEQRLLETACARPYSFYQVTGIEPGQALELEDLLTGRCWRVNERAATECVSRHGILYGRIVPIDDHAILVGAGPYEIPPQHVWNILELGAKIRGRRERIDEDELLDWEIELRNLHLEITQMLESPALPIICNSDGEPLVPTELFYRLDCSVDEAFAALRDLAVGCSDEQLLHGAKRDPGGALRCVDVTWLRKGHKQMAGADNTVLGELRIEGDRLRVDVNSEQRAKRIRSEIRKRLGKRAVHDRSVIQSIDKLLQEARRSPPRPGERRGIERQEALEREPEVQALMRRLMEEQWRTWPDEKIPALGDVSPREAARTPAGRQRLEHLLREYAWRDERQPNPDLRAPVDRLRRELGLS